MIQFACPSCEKVYSVPNTAGGKAATCKQCGGRFQVPEAPPPEPEELQPDAEPEPQADYEEVVDEPPPPEPVSTTDATRLSPALSHLPPFHAEGEFSFAPPAPPPPPPPPVMVTLAPCPTCGTRMTVPKDDVGGQVECSGCKSSFFAVDGTPKPPPPPPPPPPPAVTVGIAPCPKCGAELTVEVDDLGKQIECPHCQTSYQAKRPATLAPVLATVTTKKPSGPTVVAPARKRDDDDVPAARPADKGDKPYEFKAKKKTTGPYKDDRDNEEHEDEEWERKRREEPKKKKKRNLKQYDSRHRTYLPHDGVMLLVIALVSFVLDGIGLFCIVGYFAAPLLCGYVLIKGLYSLSEIRKRIMDPAGSTLIIVALIVAGICILSSVGLILHHFLIVLPERQAIQNGGG